MTVETKLFATLDAHPGLSALTGSRIYPLKAPQNATLPYVLYTMITAIPTPAMGDDAPVTQYIFTLESIGSTYGESKQVAAQVRDCLQRYVEGNGADQIRSTHLTSETDLYDDTVEYYRTEQNYDIYYGD